MVGRTVKENQVTARQIPNTSQELIMLICPRVYFCTLFPNLQLLLAALTALTFRHSPLPPATLWAGFLSALQRLQGPCTKSRNLSNSTRRSFPHPAGAKATSSCRAAASRAPGTAAPPRGFSESSWPGCFPSPLCQELFPLTFLSPVPRNRNGARCCSCSVTNGLTSVLGYQQTHPSSR